MENNGKIVFQTTNRTVLWCIAAAVYLAENMYYGWNEKPMSDMEQWWDYFCIILMVFSVTVKRMHFVIIDKRSQS